MWIYNYVLITAVQQSDPIMCVCVCVCVCVLVTQLCPTLCDSIDYSPPDSSVHGILRARILKSIAIPFSGGSSRPRDQTQVSCIAGRFYLLSEPPKKTEGSPDRVVGNKGT